MQTGTPVTDFSVQYAMLASPPFDTGGMEAGKPGSPIQTAISAWKEFP